MRTVVSREWIVQRARELLAHTYVPIFYQHTFSRGVPRYYSIRNTAVLIYTTFESINLLLLIVLNLVENYRGAATRVQGGIRVMRITVILFIINFGAWVLEQIVENCVTRVSRQVLGIGVIFDKVMTKTRSDRSAPACPKPVRIVVVHQ